MRGPLILVVTFLCALYNLENGIDNQNLGRI